MFQLKPKHGLVWKEWREKRRMLAGMILLSTMPLLPSEGISEFLRSVGIYRPHAFCGAIAFASALLLGVSLFGPLETDPARSFLHTLPISRGRLIRLKLYALTWHVLLLLLAVLLLQDYLTALSETLFRERGLRLVTPDSGYGGAIGFFVGGDGPQYLVIGLHVAALGAALTLYFQRPISAWIIGAIAAFPSVAIYTVRASIEPEGGVPAPSTLDLLLPAVLSALLLMAWTVVQYRRPVVAETHPVLRLWLGILFILGMLEAGFALFAVNWRDMLYVMTGF